MVSSLPHAPHKATEIARLVVGDDEDFAVDAHIRLGRLRHRAVLAKLHACETACVCDVCIVSEIEEVAL